MGVFQHGTPGGGEMTDPGSPSVRDERLTFVQKVSKTQLKIFFLKVLGLGNSIE